MDLRVKDIGEDALISRLVAGGSKVDGTVVIGPGDDCAVIDRGGEGDFYQLFKTDCVIESVHFLPGTDPERVGWKAMCRAVSDIAAMGGMPQHTLVTLALDGDRQVSEVEGWYRGMRKAAADFGGFTIVGGETALLPNAGAVIGVAMVGEVRKDRLATRSGACAGDLIAVTGHLGGSFESGRHLDFRPALAEASWLMKQDSSIRPTAMMDLSDGLAKDLPRLADRSGIAGFQIDFSTIPINCDSKLDAAIGEGEDYELLLTIPNDGAVELTEMWQAEFPSRAITMIGKLTNEGRTPLCGGWQHFEA